MSPDEELRRAGQAQRLLDDAMFKAAREDVYGQLRAARIAAPTTASDLHSRLILMEQIADRFFGYFDQIAQTGKFAQDYLAGQREQQKSWAQRMRSYAQLGRAGL